jgi:site-specific recombinase XerD
MVERAVLTAEWVEVEPGVEVLDGATWSVVDVPARIETSTEIELVQELSVEEILKVFVTWMRLDVADGHASPETLRSYLCDVRQHLEWLRDEGLSPATATDDDLKAYRAWLVESEYAVSTVGRKLVGVRRFYEMAHARGKLGQNPAARLKSPVDKTDRSERVKYLTWEAVKRLLNLPTRMHRAERAPKGLRDRAMMTLMAVHGCRVCEVARLSLADFDPDAHDFGTLRLFGKGSKYRTVILTEESRSILDVWLKARNLMRVEDDALFVTLHWGVREGEEPNHRISTRSIRATVDGYLETAGLKRTGISCHALRHSYATLSLAMGAPLLAISKSMGHASVTTTQVYAEIIDQVKNNPARLLGGLVEPAEDE